MTCDRFRVLGQDCEAAANDLPASGALAVLRELGDTASGQVSTKQPLGSLGGVGAGDDPDEILRRAQAIVRAAESEATLRPKLKPILPDDGTNGDRIILQLAEFASIEAALAERLRVRAAFPKLLRSRDVLIRTVNQASGRKRYWMVVQSFPDRGSATDLCDGLRSRGQACEVTRLGALTEGSRQDVSYGPDFGDSREFPTHK